MLVLQASNKLHRFKAKSLGKLICKNDLMNEKKNDEKCVVEKQSAVQVLPQFTLVPTIVSSVRNSHIFSHKNTSTISLPFYSTYQPT